MKVTDQTIERSVSVLLLGGVIISAIVTLIGGAIFLYHHWGEPVDYSHFNGQPRIDRYIPAILANAIHLRGRSIIQLGILLLIATPVVRVAYSLVGFAYERDRKFILITTIVLLVLLYSLISDALTSA